MQTLIPFTPHNDPIKVEAQIELIAGRDIQLSYRLHDPEHLTLDSLRPGTGNDAFRADGLWKSTCFEAFWGIPGKEHYWEVNFSGSQPKWQLYRCESYRVPTPPVESYDYELVNWEKTPTSMVCLLRGKEQTPKIEASLCVIVRTANAEHNFSVAHEGSRPDFHIRKSFRLKLGRD